MYANKDWEDDKIDFSLFSLGKPTHSIILKLEENARLAVAIEIACMVWL
jgi:hypothetical protein